MSAPPSSPHFIPESLNRCVKTILQAASVTPLPLQKFRGPTGVCHLAENVFKVDRRRTLRLQSCNYIRCHQTG